MKFLELKNRIKQNIFTTTEVSKIFSQEKRSSLRIQLARFTKRKLIFSIKRGFYCFDIKLIDELSLANQLYIPSYVSLETALNYYGIMPDVPQTVTSVNPTTTKIIKSNLGRFYYYKINRSLFWGYSKVKTPQENAFILIAQKEKALLDFLYIRKITKTDDLRLNLKEFKISLYKKYLKYFPRHIQKINLKQKP